jgi:hypothetical protein
LAIVFELNGVWVGAAPNHSPIDLMLRPRAVRASGFHDLFQAEAATRLDTPRSEMDGENVCLVPAVALEIPRNHSPSRGEGLIRPLDCDQATEAQSTQV